MKHHLINEIHQIKECPYCRNNLKKHEWESVLELQHHYKETSCDKCGKPIRVKVNFDGSGHDCWDNNSEFCKLINNVPKAEKPLEEKIEEK